MAWCRSIVYSAEGIGLPFLRCLKNRYVGELRTWYFHPLAGNGLRCGLVAFKVYTCEEDIVSGNREIGFPTILRTRMAVKKCNERHAER